MYAFLLKEWHKTSYITELACKNETKRWLEKLRRPSSTGHGIKNETKKGGKCSINCT